jgi:hypothetical protein
LGLLPARGPQQSHPSQDRRACLDCPILITWGAVATQNGRHTVHGRTAQTLSECARPRRGRIFSRHRSVLGYWFRQKEKAQAIAMILIGIPLASVLGPISGLTLDHTHRFGLSSWRCLFILEGLPAATCPFLVPLLLPSRPAEGKISRHRREGLDRRPIGATRPAEAGRQEAIHFCGADSG